MFEYLVPRPADAIMALMEAAKADPNPHKIDLGVGIYKDDHGATTVMKAVKEAEKRWLDEEDTKKYVSTVGRADFRDEMSAMVFGADNPVITEGRLATAQAAGGSGALRLGAEIIKSAAPDATVWVSTPTWANHVPLISSPGLKMEEYPYYNRETLGVDFEDMLDRLKSKAKAGDVVLLHGCCHNPSGADLSIEQWDIIAEFMKEKSLLPFIDLAYFGLGQGMEEDAYGVKKTLSICPEAIVAMSCSKNFGLYRDRVGMVAVITKDTKTAEIAQSQLSAIQRKVISMPPDHGAALVAKILSDAELRKLWVNELDAMRNRMIDLRRLFSKELSVQGSEVMAAAVKNQNGMFSTLPVSKAQAEALREKHSVYMTNSGRINIAAATADNIPRLATAILDVL